jgi:hypothetical protein
MPSFAGGKELTCNQHQKNDVHALNHDYPSHFSVAKQFKMIKIVLFVDICGFGDCWLRGFRGKVFCKNASSDIKTPSFTPSPSHTSLE